MEALLANEPNLYALVTFGAIAVMLVWEGLAPYRDQVAGRNARWRLNFGLMAIGMVLLALLVPGSLVSLALWASRSGLGLFNSLAVGQLPAMLTSILIMDLGKYAQHWAMHNVPWLWRIHQTHHSDTEMDVTTSARFHPFELLFTLLTDGLIIVLTGCPAIAVVLYRLARLGVSAFVHGNVTLPGATERVLRNIAATPDFHRIHHSIDPHEQARNLSGGFIWWDRLFGTHLASSGSDARRMRLGLDGVSAADAVHLRATLLMPMVRR